MIVRTLISEIVTKDFGCSQIDCRCHLLVDFHQGAYQEGDRQDLVGQDHLGLDGIQVEVLTYRQDHQDHLDRLGLLGLGVSIS